MNRELKQRYPHIPWQENVPGNPRMRTSILPEGARKLLSVEQLDEVSYDYYRENKRPVPLFVFMPAICKDAQEEYDVNYAHPQSALSMQMADSLVKQGRVWIESTECY